MISPSRFEKGLMMRSSVTRSTKITSKERKGRPSSKIRSKSNALEGRPTKPETIEIAIKSIKILDRRRIDESVVVSLAKSIQREGLHYPIAVYWRGGLYSKKYVAVAGNHRLRAATYLGHETILAEVLDPEKADAWRCAENVLRNELPPLERALAIADFARFVMPKIASQKGGRQPHDRNISRVSKELGFGRRVVRNAFLIDTLTEPIRELAIDSRLDKNEAFLVSIAQLETEDEQRAAIRRKAGAKPALNGEAPEKDEWDTTELRQNRGEKNGPNDWDSEADPPSAPDPLSQLWDSWQRSPTEALFSASSEEVRRKFQQRLMQ